MGDDFLGAEEEGCLENMGREGCRGVITAAAVIGEDREVDISRMVGVEEGR